VGELTAAQNYSTTPVVDDKPAESARANVVKYPSFDSATESNVKQGFIQPSQARTFLAEKVHERPVNPTCAFTPDTLQRICRAGWK
jgi:hypothetical protein